MAEANLNRMKELMEKFGFTQLRMPQNIEVSEEEKNQIKQLQWSDLKIDQLNDTSPVHLQIDVPWDSIISDGIVVDIQLTGNNLFQIHIAIAESIRSLGLGYKIYKAVTMTYGHVYSGHGRRQNQNEVEKIWGRLKQDPDLECYHNNLGNLCISKRVPEDQKQELLNNFNK